MKTLFITGAGEGIGFFMVQEWLKSGGRAAVADINTNQLEILKDKYSDNLIFFDCDVRDCEKLQTAVNQTIEAFGIIDFAVHNACLCQFKSFVEHAKKDFEDVMRVNLGGAINLTNAVLPAMLAKGCGDIYFTSSGVGVTGFGGICSYSASKGAIESLAKCLRIEYKNSGVRFHLLHPPLTNTKSSAPLPVPKEFMASPEKVGIGLARRLSKKKFIITHSAGNAFSLRMSYLFPVAMGGMLAKMTARAAENNN